VNIAKQELYIQTLHVFSSYKRSSWEIKRSACTCVNLSTHDYQSFPHSQSKFVYIAKQSNSKCTHKFIYGLSIYTNTPCCPGTFSLGSLLFAFSRPEEFPVFLVVFACQSTSSSRSLAGGFKRSTGSTHEEHPEQGHRLAQDRKLHFEGGSQLGMKTDWIRSLFASLKSYGWNYCLLICCEKKTLFWLKKQAEKYEL
jgi:hypothetical protein